LSDAQDLLQERGFINEMVAIGTRAAWTEPGRMQREIEALAPELRVVVNAPRTAAALRARASAEHETLAMTKLEEEARTRTVHNRSRIALALNGLMALICGAWIALLAYGNTVERNTEAGLWFALGVPQGAVARLFAAKWLSLCLLGAALGLGAAPVLTRVGARWLPRFRLTDVSWRINADTAGLALLLALALAGLASWIPVRLAARRDPAALLKGE
jgi:ABC-type lipoprotein release transport system permease subunit